ncbi:nuclear transport factor 2 family protein [Nocardiaceae bacterium NPDC056970]
MRFGFLAGCATAVLGRTALRELLLFKFRHDVQALNGGDYRPLLASYRDDAVLRFADGDHRWAGEHRGRPAIAAFLQSFVDAGLRGEISAVYFGGAPWRMTIVARFDDRADAPDGSPLYRNRTVLLVRTRWGRIVEQEDFYVDTARIDEFDARLRELHDNT